MHTTTPQQGRLTVDMTLEPHLLAAVDALAAQQGRERADMLRYLLLQGLDVKHTCPTGLAADPDVDVIHDDVIDSERSGIRVHSDGHRHWITCFETGELMGFTTDPRCALAIRAAALLVYERITHLDTMDGREDEEEYDAGQVSLPELVTKGHELLAALAQSRGELPQQP
ncbi:MAG TPA: hypothetical protein VN520_35345 [Streptomyces sp.]|uniref:hypothetical protein n=1 Tax=Streptomyces sp. TaxID=1931 RepID=UPI002BCB21F6|nr:hypothetical protein [Streptomyces sp.]HWU11572.1 hypothetical protein [Streptomyces sp.]